MRLQSLRIALGLVAGFEALACAVARAEDAARIDPPVQLLATEEFLTDLAGRIYPTVVSIRRFVRDDVWWERVRTGQDLPSGWRQVSDADLLYPGYRPEGGGSGFLVAADGYIMSLNRIAIDPATRKAAEILDVQVGADHYRARVVALEPTIDFAILKIDPTAGVPFLKQGFSGGLRTGQMTFAFGDPPGPEETIAPGIIVYTPSRDCYQDELSATYIQTSAAVCSGALGGPVVNLQGTVIGISTVRADTAVRDSSHVALGSGWVLPINLTTAIYQSLLLRESRKSPWLGVSVLLLTDDQRSQLGKRGSGVMIDNVFDPSPAAAAGIRIGDVLQSLNGETIASVYDFQRLLYRCEIGAQVKLGILRDRKPRQIDATISERPPEATTR